jgi:hypothetical protein
MIGALTRALRATIKALEYAEAELGSYSLAAQVWAHCNGYGGSPDARAILKQAKEYQKEHAQDRPFARRLALALADEVAFIGDEAAEESFAVLTEARERLDLSKEFDEIDSLTNRKDRPCHTPNGSG